MVKLIHPIILILPINTNMYKKENKISMIFFFNTLSRSSPFFYNHQKKSRKIIRIENSLVPKEIPQKSKFLSCYTIRDYKRGKWGTRLRTGRRTVTIGPRLISSIIVGRPYRGYFINIQSYFENGRSKPEGSNNHPSNLRVIAEMDARWLFIKSIATVAGCERGEGRGWCAAW